MDEREMIERTLIQLKCMLKNAELYEEKQKINKRIAENPNPQAGDYAEAIVDLLIIKAQLDGIEQLAKQSRV